MITPEITNEAKELISELTPAITNLIELKNKFPNQPQELFKIHIDATYADIIKTIYLKTGFLFDSECEFFKK